MRSPHSRISARRRARAAGSTLARHFRVRYIPNLSVQIGRALAPVWQRIGQGRGRGRWSPLPISLALLVLVLLLAGWSARGIAAKPNAQPLAARQQLASGPRTLARWIDPADGTALLLALLEAPNQPPGAVTFTLPSGDEIRAEKVGSPLLVLARQLSQLSADAPFDVATTVCGPATLLAAKPATAAIAQPVAMVLGVHVGQGGLLAYAGLSFVALGQAAFAASACVLTSPQYEMKAGCSDLKSPCAPLPTPTQAVGQYNQAVVGAAQSGDWNSVWVLTSQAVTAQYTSGTFVEVMKQQVQGVGRITSIMPSGAPPTVQFSAAGQAYFNSQDTVTLDHNGSTKQLLITSYYLLEGGSWKFWFSCQPGSC